MVDVKQLELGQVVFILDTNDDEIRETKIVGLHNVLNTYRGQESEWKVEVNDNNRSYGSSSNTSETNPEDIYLTEKDAITALRKRITDEQKERHSKIRIVRIEEKKL